MRNALCLGLYHQDIVLPAISESGLVMLSVERGKITVSYLVLEFKRLECNALAFRRIINQWYPVAHASCCDKAAMTQVQG